MTVGKAVANLKLLASSVLIQPSLQDLKTTMQNLRTSSSRKALFRSIRRNKPENAEYALHWLGASPNTMNTGGETALEVASELGHVDIMAVLIDAGANLDLETVRGTPLHAAARNSKSSALRALLERGATVDTLNRTGETPLMEASKHGCVNCVQILLNAGSDVGTALSVAVRHGHDDVVEALISAGADMNSMDSTGDAPIHIAATDLRCKALRVLVARGADIYAVSDDDFPTEPLDRAAGSGCDSAMQMLLDAGASLINSNGMCSCLVEATISGCSSTVRMVLQEMEQIGEAATDGQGMVHLALSRGAVYCLQVLLEAGVGIDARGVDQRYQSVYMASKLGRERCLQVLLDAGVPALRRRAKAYQTPLHAAAECGHRKCLELLLSPRVIRKNKLSVDYGDQSGNTPLMLAALKGDKDCLELLIAAGANVNAINDRGSAPIHAAVKFGHAACVSVLAGAGANVNIQDALEQNTPLHLAMVEAQYECAKSLLLAGASTSLRNKNGFTCSQEGTFRSSGIGLHQYEATCSLISHFNPRTHHLLRWRRAHRAHYDAARVFKAASEGRPMELGKRLRLGKLAGGLTMTGVVEGGHRVTPVMAAALHGHTDCVKVLNAAGARIGLGDVQAVAGSGNLHGVLQDQGARARQGVSAGKAAVLQEKRVLQGGL